MKTQFETKLQTIRSTFNKTLHDLENKNKSSSDSQTQSHNKLIEDLKTGMEIREHQLLEEIDMLKDTMHKIVTSQNNEYENMLNQERERFQEIINNMKKSRERDLDLELNSRMEKF